MASLLLGTPQGGCSLDAAFARFKKTQASCPPKPVAPVVPIEEKALSTASLSDSEVKTDVPSEQGSREASVIESESEEKTSSAGSVSGETPVLSEVDLSTTTIRPPPGLASALTTTVVDEPLLAEDDADDEGSQKGVPQGDIALPSKGSAGHFNGTCDRCCFFPKGRCINGYNCDHCHFEHEKRKRKNKKKKAEEEKEEEKINAQAEEDDAATRLTILDLLSANPSLQKTSIANPDKMNDAAAQRTSSKNSLESTTSGFSPISAGISASVYSSQSDDQKESGYCTPPPGLELPTMMPTTALGECTLSATALLAYEEALEEGAREAEENGYMFFAGETMDWMVPIDYETPNSYQLELKDQRIAQLEAENEQLRKLLQDSMGFNEAAKLVKESKPTTQRTSLRGALSAKATPFVPFQAKSTDDLDVPECSS
mmetsp:Transcript_35358/g.64713  ORF Transcript_35358/g.64713 Transcript_35358/m.64713 type:complete len:429 (+) Transcript_35358:79-1365(+)